MKVKYNLITMNALQTYSKLWVIIIIKSIILKIYEIITFLVGNKITYKYFKRIGLIFSEKVRVQEENKF